MNVTPLQGAVQRCSLHALLLITTQVLKRQGFDDVHILDRRQSRERSRFGGHELLVEGHVGDLPVSAIVKVIRDSARIRNLDELIGAVDRRGADLGILVTPHHVTRTAVTVLSSYTSGRIEVLDGASFTDLMRRFKIGVRGYDDVDYAFFGGIEEASQRYLRLLTELE